MSNQPHKPGTSTTAGIGRSMREAQPYLDAMWQFIASIAVMAWVGWWADGRFGTRPWGLVAGALLGFAAGAWAFVRVVLAHGTKKPGGPSEGR
jgi:F0F1-type ATP synthase assembly protein I